MGPGRSIGAPAVYKAIEPKDTANDKCSSSSARGTTDRQSGTAVSLGKIRFDTDTALTFRREVLRPFLDQHLKDGAPKADVAPVVAFETGTNTWRRLNAWPAGKPTPLYLAAGGKVGFAAPAAGGAPFQEYVSDPAKPVPYISRPAFPSSHDGGKTWQQWLVSDQREASGRPDVAVFVSDVLTSPVRSRRADREPRRVDERHGPDWVAVDRRLPGQVGASGKWAVSAHGVGRHLPRALSREPRDAEGPRVRPAAPVPIRPTHRKPRVPAGAPHHGAGPVELFPLYDRNPQKFVPNIFWAKPEDYVKAVQRVYHAPGQASFIELPLVTAP